LINPDDASSAARLEASIISPMRGSPRRAIIEATSIRPECNLRVKAISVNPIAAITIAAARLKCSEPIRARDTGISEREDVMVSTLKV